MNFKIKNLVNVRIVLANAIMVLACVSACSAAEIKPARTDILNRELRQPYGRVMVVAHRGNWKHAPENSVAAIQGCIAMGVDIVEVDVRKTRDGQLILMHDATVDRTTDGHGKISEMTLAEIKQLHLKDHKGNITDHRVPLLEEAMLAAKDTCLVNLDKIGTIMDDAMAVLKKTGTQSNALIKSNYQTDTAGKFFDSIDESINYMPVIKFHGPDTPKLEEFFSMLDELQGKCVAVELVFDDDRHPIISPETVDMIKKRGLRVWVNTLDVRYSGSHIDPLPNEKPLAWDWLINRGVNMIQTDEPQRLVEYLSEAEDKKTGL